MRRVWVVDDRIPIQALYGGPFPSSMEAELVRHLVEVIGADAWEEAQVFALCQAFCAAEYDTTFFLSPEAMLRALERGAVPPHAVIFDWQYPGSTNERNLEALDRLLGSTFAYGQVYTHLGAEGVQPLLADLATKYGPRLLAPKTKADVTPAQLSAHVTQAWSGTIAGVLADRVRQEVSTAVERTLIDMCEIGRGTIASMVQGEPDNFIHVVLAKVRDEVGLRGAEALEHRGDSHQGLEALLKENRATERSLGIIQPDAGSLQFFHRAAKADERQDVGSMQASLFEKPLRTLTPPEFVFGYKYTSGGRSHTHTLQDWEVQAAYLAYLRPKRRCARSSRSTASASPRATLTSSWAP
jgi:hypothetical protein